MSKIPVIGQSGLIFRETFEDESTVISNGGNPTDVTFNGDGTATFNGTSSYISYDSLPPLAFPTGEITMMAWITTTDTQGEIVCNFEEASPFEGFSLAVRGGGPFNGKLTGWASGPNGSGWSSDAGSEIDTGTKTHVAITYDGVNVTFYQNGAQTSSGATNDYPGLSFNKLEIGRDCNAAPSRYLNATLEDVRIYNRALNETEIDDIQSGEGTYNFEGEALLHLPCRVSYDDGADQVTDNIGLVGSTLTMGDGSTPGKMPTQLSPHGFSFDGSQYLEMDADSQLQITGDVSFGCWVNPMSVGQSSGSVIMSMSASGETEAVNVNYSMYLANGTTDLYYLHEYGAGSNEAYDTGITLDIGRLVHIYMCRNTADKEVYIYVNGVSQGLVSYTNAPTGGTSSNLWIGTLWAGANTYFDGNIFTPSIHDDTLTTSQVQWLYQKQKRLLNV